MRFSYYGQPPVQYAETPEMGYYGAPAPAFYGYDAPGPADYAGYAGYGGYGGYNGYGGYAGYAPYGNPEPVGYYAEETPLGYYGDDPYAHMQGYAGYGHPGYGHPGYGEPVEGYGHPYGNPYGNPYADPYGDPYSQSYGESCGEPEGMGGDEFSDDSNDYGEQEMGGYVRDMPPAFNAGCPMPTNVGMGNVGMGDADTFAGYVRPSDVSPSCREFTPASKSTATLPETLKPLW